MAVRKIERWTRLSFKTPAADIADHDDPDPIDGAITSFVLCPRPLPGDTVSAEPAVVVAGQPPFAELEKAISVRDSRQRGACADVVEDFRMLWALAGERVYLVHLPRNECSWYRPELDALLERLLPRSS